MGKETRDKNRGGGGPAIGIGPPSDRIQNIAKQLDKRQVIKKSMPKPKEKK